MTNVRFDSIEDYNDVAIKNLYQIETENGKSHEEIMQEIWKNVRDNSRTPMQWNAGENAGFTTGTLWIKTNPNYLDINVAQDLENPDSIYHHYKRLIRLRKEYPAAVYGTYDLVMEEHERIYAYTRTLGDHQLLVLVNLFDEETVLTLPKDLEYATAELLITNEGTDLADGISNEMMFKPYESRVYFFHHHEDKNRVRFQPA